MTHTHAFKTQFIATTVLLVLLAACGGQPDVPPDDLDIPTTLPREQILYREAKDVFTKWMSVFEAGSNSNAGYSIQTWKSRQNLKSQGVNNATDFGTWFEKQKEAGRAPFSYEFSRVDVLEIGLNDTNKAVITATFVVHVNDQKFESVGIFYLKRELDTWKVPFAERSDYIRGWWQKEQNFDVSVNEAGISTYAAGDYQVEFKYPVAWDVSEHQSFKLPLIPEAMKGLLLTYNNPSTQQVETIVRITELPETMVPPEVLADTTSQKIRPVREEMANVLSEPGYQGRLFWLYNPASKRVLAVYAAVDTSLAPYDSYAESIDDLVRSVEILK